jgi:hypothetical protein
MQPDVGDVHVNAVLSGVSVGWQPAGFFATKVFPVVGVDRQTNIYPKYNKSFWARDLGGPGSAPTGSGQAVRRAPGTEARTAGFTVDVTNTYRTVNYALGFEISDELRANVDGPFNLDRDATVLLNSLLALRFDREFVADFLAVSTWGTDQTISSKWNSYGASTPIEDLRTACNTLRQKTLGMSSAGGVKLMLGALTEQRLLDHPDFLERIKYGGSNANPAKVNMQLLAQILDLDEVISCKSVYTSDEEGTAEASVTYADVFSDDALLFWTPPSASQLAPSAGYLFNWASLAGGGGLTYARKGREDRPRYEWVEVHANLDWVLTESSSGVYMDDAVD